jgi:type II secretory pathway component PulF
MKTQNITLSPKEKMILVSNFSTMLSAGISILEVVDSLMEDAKGNQKKVLEALKADLIQGKHVYASFAQFPKIFDKVTLNIIKASEEAGTLDVALKDLKANIKKEMEFSDSIKSALIYPILISIVFIGVLLVILVVVVPKISTVFLRLKMDLPLPTKILIFSSNLILKNTFALVMGLAAFIFTLVFLMKTKRQAIMDILFSLPVINKLAANIDLARFSRSLYLLLNAGIPISTALEFAQDTIKIGKLKKLIQGTRDKVIAGRRFSEGLKEAKGTIPYIMIKIIEAGEKTGSLDKSMQEISDFMDYEVQSSLQTVTALIEPIMLIGVGLMVGGMMMSIIAPIYGLIGSVGSAAH